MARLVTEKEAEELRCPMSYGHNCMTSGINCNGKKCMAFERVEVKHNRGEKWYRCALVQNDHAFETLHR